MRPAFGRSGEHQLTKATHDARLARERDARGENCIASDPTNYDPVVERRRLDCELWITLVVLGGCLLALAIVFGSAYR